MLLQPVQEIAEHLPLVVEVLATDRMKVSGRSTLALALPVVRAGEAPAAGPLTLRSPFSSCLILER
jgi:hypothetical protein